MKHAITFITVGRMKDAHLKAAALNQLANLNKYARADWIELTASRASDPAAWARARNQEAERLARAWPLRAVKVVLDESGRTFTSEAFARWMKPSLEAGRPLAFAVGNHWGWAESARSHADLVWSLSPLTFPHEVCILCGLEQVFRALSIVHGSPYHRIGHRIGEPHGNHQI